MAEETIKIGFANLDAKNLFAQEVADSLLAAADKHPDVEVIIRDNAMNSENAKANITEFLQIPVDVAIMFHIDQRANTQLIFPLRLKKIPTLALHIPIPGSYFFGIDEAASGNIAGEALVKWVTQHWDKQIDRIVCFTDQNVTDSAHGRFTSALEVIQSHDFAADIEPLYLDNGSNRETSHERFGDILPDWDDEHIVVICINDDTAGGVIQAIRELKRTEHVAIVSYDGTDVAYDAFNAPDINFVASPYINQRESGEPILELCIKLAKNETIPLQSYVKSEPLTYENFHEQQSQ